MLRRLSRNWMIAGSNPVTDKILSIFHVLGRKNREIQTCCNRVSRINFEEKTYDNPILVLIFEIDELWL